MYSVSRQTHAKYGNVIEVSRVEDGKHTSPFDAANYAKRDRRLWSAEGATKIRYLIDSQLLNNKQLEHWSNEEYKSLPKCFGCASILKETVFNHKHSINLFCSSKCADRDYLEYLEKLEDEEECDFR